MCKLQNKAHKTFDPINNLTPVRPFGQVSKVSSEWIGPQGKYGGGGGQNVDGNVQQRPIRNMILECLAAYLVRRHTTYFNIPATRTGFFLLPVVE